VKNLPVQNRQRGVPCVWVDVAFHAASSRRRCHGGIR
jgi:hypothetical protein